MVSLLPRYAKKGRTQAQVPENEVLCVCWGGMALST